MSWITDQSRTTLYISVLEYNGSKQNGIYTHHLLGELCNSPVLNPCPGFAIQAHILWSLFCCLLLFQPGAARFAGLRVVQESSVVH